MGALRTIRKNKANRIKSETIKQLAVVQIARTYIRQGCEVFIDPRTGRVRTESMDPKDFKLIDLDRRLYTTLKAYTDDFLFLAEQEANKAIRGVDKSRLRGIYPGYFGLCVISQLYEQFENIRLAIGVKSLIFELFDAFEAEAAKKKVEVSEEEAKRIEAYKKDSEDYAERIVVRIKNQL